MKLCYVADVDLFGAKPFTVTTPQIATTMPDGGDVFGMPVFSPISPSSASDQEMIDMQVLAYTVTYHIILYRSTYSNTINSIKMSYACKVEHLVKIIFKQVSLRTTTTIVNSFVAVIYILSNRAFPCLGPVTVSEVNACPHDREVFMSVSKSAYFCSPVSAALWPHTSNTSVCLE